jgi:hypothetical protein
MLKIAHPPPSLAGAAYFAYALARGGELTFTVPATAMPNEDGRKSRQISNPVYCTFVLNSALASLKFGSFIEQST